MVLMLSRFRKRLQTFKINGVRGGDTNNITFDNLSFQIKNALEAGYNEPSICGAVIKKTICPSNHLRVYKNIRISILRLGPN